MFRSCWTAFVTVFALFAFMLAGANLWAETSPNLTLARVSCSILVTGVLAWPAVLLFVLFDLRRAPPSVYHAWRWFWTFGFLAYVIHSYFAVAVWFEWDYAQIERRQGRLVAWTNYVLFVAWGIEVLLDFVVGARRSAMALILLRWFALGLFVIAFVVSAVVFHNEHKSLLSLILGWAIAGSVALAVLVRLPFGDSSKWSANAVGVADHSSI